MRSSTATKAAHCAKLYAPRGAEPSFASLTARARHAGPPSAPRADDQAVALSRSWVGAVVAGLTAPAGGRCQAVERCCPRLAEHRRSDADLTRLEARGSHRLLSQRAAALPSTLGVCWATRARGGCRGHPRPGGGGPTRVLYGPLSAPSKRSRSPEAQVKNSPYPGVLTELLASLSGSHPARLLSKAECVSLCAGPRIGLPEQAVLFFRSGGSSCDPLSTTSSGPDSDTGGRALV